MDSAGCGEGSGYLTDQLIVELATKAVAAKDAKILAQRLMTITSVEVSNMKFDADSAVELASAIFRTWRNQSKETNQIKVKLLFFSLFFCHYRK